ncbi:MAG: hypothetical protein AAFR76_04185 [Planctomycetota bacterium]
MSETSKDNRNTFVWPPAPPKEPQASTSTDAHSPVATKKPRGVWHEIESAWLGSTSVALGHRGNWSPEPIDAACPRCGRSVGPGEVSPDDGRCTGCRPERLRWEKLIRLGEFDGDLRQAVLETKYTAWRRQGTLLGRLLGARIAECLRAASISPDAAVVVPSPMPWLRRMRRGIDHAMVIARGVAAASGCRLDPLLRRRQGPTQTAVAPSARAANVRRQISLARRAPADAEVLILVDDVRTTGATLDACCRALTPGQTAPPRIWAGVVSCTVEDARRRSASREVRKDVAT